jgi:hypothetical protein
MYLHLFYEGLIKKNAQITISEDRDSSISNVSKPVLKIWDRINLGCQIPLSAVCFS